MENIFFLEMLKDKIPTLERARKFYFWKFMHIEFVMDGHFHSRIWEGSIGTSYLKDLIIEYIRE